MDNNQNENDNFINEYNKYETIPKTSLSAESTNISVKHYLCPNCKHFPNLVFTDNKKVIIYCGDSDGNEMDLKKYLEFKTTKDNISQTISNESNNKCIGYCFDCKKKFYENNALQHKEHFLKNYDDMINFIKKKLKLPEMEKGETKSEPYSFTDKRNVINEYKLVNENGNDSIIKKIDNNTNIDNLYSNNPFEELIEIIIEDSKLYPNDIHYENIKNIFYYLSDQMEIEYHSYENQSLDIRIFGQNFVENNINNFILFIGEKEEKLKEIIKVKDPNEILNIKLIKINEATDLSEMFYECNCLSKIYMNKSNKWNTSNVTTMNGMFYGCKALEFLPDISEWVTDKITDLSSMFEGCEILETLPDISKWDVGNVKSMSYMFNGCESLEYLPELSNWKTNNLETIESMFQNCKNLISLKGLENWNTSQISNMSYTFQNCWSLTDLDGISYWNTEKVISFSNMFDQCENLIILPDLSNWITKKAEKMNYMLSNCKKLESLPDISKWDVQNVISMNSMFENCSSLKSFPNISKWTKNKYLDTCLMFKGCDSLKEKPNFNN